MDIICDCDDVIINHSKEWLEMYNLDYQDNLKKETITDWDMLKFVKPECGAKIYSYLESGDIYNRCNPIEGSLDGINWLKNNGHRIIFATVNNYNDKKYQWLKSHGYLKSRKDFVVTSDKSILKGEVIIDDNPDHLKKFGRKGIVFTQPWNKNYTFRRANNWDDIIKIFEYGL